MRPGKRKSPPRKKEVRTWWPKQITKEEYKKRHAAFVKLQRKMGIADEDMETEIGGRFANRI